MIPPAKVELSYKSIIFTVLFVIFVAFLYQIRHILLLLFIGVIFMSAISPLVDKLETRKIPRGLATLFFYILILAVIGYGVGSLVPPLIEQSAKLISSFPQDLNQLTKGLINPSVLEPHLKALPEQILKLVVGAVNNIFALLTFLVILFYLILERKNLHKYLLFIFGSNGTEARAEAFINRLEQKLGGWVRGQLTLMFIIGIMSYLGLLFLGVEFAVPLAFLAGLLEVIPTVGPIVSAVPAVLVALGTSPVLAIATTVLYFLIQQLENNLIVPKVMSKAVGLSPLIVIFALMAGFQVAGIAGAVLSVPMVLLAEVVINDLYLHRPKV